MSERLYNYSVKEIHTAYINKVQRKGQDISLVDDIIIWLTGYSDKELADILESDMTLGPFLKDAPAFNQNASLITGVICGIRVENIEDPLMQRVRYLDKLIDELAKGKKIEKILRA